MANLLFRLKYTFVLLKQEGLTLMAQQAQALSSCQKEETSSSGFQRDVASLFALSIAALCDGLQAT